MNRLDSHPSNLKHARCPTLRYLLIFLKKCIHLSANIVGNAFLVKAIDKCMSESIREKGLSFARTVIKAFITALICALMSAFTLESVPTNVSFVWKRFLRNPICIIMNWFINSRKISFSYSLVRSLFAFPAFNVDYCYLDIWYKS